MDINSILKLIVLNLLYFRNDMIDVPIKFTHFRAKMANQNVVETEAYTFYIVRQLK